jgi:hypothetical protein
MNYVSTPLSFLETDSSLKLNRDLDNRIAMIDNLIELIVFTPKGSFLADPDFGFEYWSHEYANIHYRSFNNGQSITTTDGNYREITKAECQESIRRSLATYEPSLKNVSISIELNAASIDKQRRKKVLSKHIVRVDIEGLLENGPGTFQPYKKEVVFLMEPTLKRGSAIAV